MYIKHCILNSFMSSVEEEKFQRQIPWEEIAPNEPMTFVLQMSTTRPLS